MLAFILRRAALIVPTFIGVTLLAFALIHLIPGDPVEIMLADQRATEAQAAARARKAPWPAMTAVSRWG